MKRYSGINSSGYNWSSVPCIIIAVRQTHPLLTKCQKKSTNLEFLLENDIQLEARFLYTSQKKKITSVQSNVFCFTLT